MTRFDHALIYVADLPRAARDYAALGFTVVPGGAHEGDPTENALVLFADGSYLELIAFRRRRSRALLASLARLGLLRALVRAPLARRFAVRAACGAGLIDVVVGVDRIATVVETGRRAGVAIDGPVSGRRAAAGGAPIVWELGVPRDDALPLFIADITARELRVAGSDSIRHANGVTGVWGVVLSARDPRLAVKRLRDVVQPSSPLDEGVDSLVLGPTRLAFALDSRAPAHRPLRLSLASSRRAELDVARAHGAVIDLR